MEPQTMFSSEEQVKISDPVINFLFLHNNRDTRDGWPLIDEFFSTSVICEKTFLYVFPSINIMLS